MPVSETDYQCSNRNIYISEIWVLINTHPQKLEHTLKLVYTLNCNFLGFTYTKLTIISYPLIITYPFCWKNLPFPIFLENRQNSNPHPLCGGHQLWFINTTCFTSLLLQVKPVIIKTISNLRMRHWLNFKLKKD